MSLTEAQINAGEEVCLTITTTGEVSWSPNEGVQNFDNSYCLSPLTSTNYSFTSTAEGCNEEITVAINVIPPAEVPDPIPATVGNFVFEDLDKDGIQDENEIGIPNVIVKLQDENGTIIDTISTNENGFYQFTILDPNGLYKVMFNTPEGYEPTTQSGTASDNGADDSDNDPISGMTDLFPVNPGDSIPTIDAGFIVESEPEICTISSDLTDTDIYTDQQACITLSGAANYLITPNLNIQQTSDSTFCLSPDETTIYTIQSPTSNCNELQIEIRVWNELTSDCVQVDKTSEDITIGQSACVNVTGIGGYIWSPSEGITENGNTYCFSPTQTTTYTLRSTIPGCTAERQVEIRVWQEDATIPTMSEWGLLIFGLLILNVSIFFLQRREEISEFN